MVITDEYHFQNLRIQPEVLKMAYRVFGLSRMEASLISSYRLR